MSVPVELMIYVAVVGAVGAAFLVRKHRRSARKPPLGDADAYDGNLLILPPGHVQRGKPVFRSSHSTGHIADGQRHGVHVGHGAGHSGIGLH